MKRLCGKEIESSMDGFPNNATLQWKLHAGRIAWTLLTGLISQIRNIPSVYTRTGLLHPTRNICYHHFGPCTHHQGQDLVGNYSLI